MLKEIIFAPDALRDLSNIIKYSNTRWGKKTSQSYLEVIKQKISSLSKDPELGISRDEIFKHTRSLVVKSHVIYYRVHKHNLEIIRVLHGRQDAFQIQQKLSE